MKLLAVIGVLVVSRATTTFPSLVTKVAVYFLPGSRQLGGADLKVVMRGDDPSGLGQVVAAVSVPPMAGAAVGGVAVAAVVDDPTAVVDDPTAVVDVDDEVDTFLLPPWVAL